MSNSLSLSLGALFVAVGIGISGGVTEATKAYFHRQLEAACWDDSVVGALSDLATQEALPGFRNSYPAAMSQRDQDQVAGSLMLALSDYSFTGATDGSGTVNCDATVKFTYTRPDHTTVTNDDGHIVTFRAQPSRDGYLAEMSADDIPNGVVVYTDDGQSPSNGTTN